MVGVERTLAYREDTQRRRASVPLVRLGSPLDWTFVAFRNKIRCLFPQMGHVHVPLVLRKGPLARMVAHAGEGVLPTRESCLSQLLLLHGHRGEVLLEEAAAFVLPRVKLVN